MSQRHLAFRGFILTIELLLVGNNVHGCILLRGVHNGGIILAAHQRSDRGVCTPFIAELNASSPALTVWAMTTIGLPRGITTGLNNASPGLQCRVIDLMTSQQKPAIYR
jgi:hypothetical protein